MCKLAISTLMLCSVTCASQVEVVLAHHSEDLSWTSQIPSDVHLHGYTKGPQPQPNMQLAAGSTLEQLPNVGRESHTYLHHIVKNYERLAPWTVFSQAGQPSFGYKGHRSGGGHLMAGDHFSHYLTPDPSGSRFVYTSAVHLPSMNHVLRAAYCIEDELLEGSGARTCPKEASQWTPWWDVADFRKFVSSKVQDQHGIEIMDFYHKYINPAHTEENVVASFPQGARFAVSQEMIMRRPKSDYQRLLAILSSDEDSYAGYFMEWFWSELFVGHEQPCPLPAKHIPVTHAQAMDTLTLRFPKSVEKYFSSARMLSETGISGGVSGGVSGGISGGVSGGVPGGISGGVSGGVSGGSSGGASTTMLATTTTTTTFVEGNVTTVAGTIEVQIEVQGNLTQEDLENMFRRGIANALNISIDQVVKLTASEMQQGSRLRRLQSIQTKRYEVSYEVSLPSSTGIDVLVAKLNRIAESDTMESQVFRQVLTDTDGVAKVGQIVSKIAAHAVDDKIATTFPVDDGKDEGRSWIAVVIGSVAIAVAAGCVGTGFVMLKRKMMS